MKRCPAPGARLFRSSIILKRSILRCFYFGHPVVSHFRQFMRQSRVYMLERLERVDQGNVDSVLHCRFRCSSRRIGR
jgi:hypothetical protein